MINWLLTVQNNADTVWKGSELLTARLIGGLSRAWDNGRWGWPTEPPADALQEGSKLGGGGPYVCKQSQLGAKDNALGALMFKLPFFLALSHPDLMCFARGVRGFVAMSSRRSVDIEAFIGWALKWVSSLARCWVLSFGPVPALLLRWGSCILLANWDLSQCCTAAEFMEVGAWSSLTCSAFAEHVLLSSFNKHHLLFLLLLQTLYFSFIFPYLSQISRATFAFSPYLSTPITWGHQILKSRHLV